MHRPLVRVFSQFNNRCLNTSTPAGSTCYDGFSLGLRTKFQAIGYKLGTAVERM